MIFFFFFLTNLSKCLLNLYPFVRNGRTVQNIGNTRFVLHDSSILDPDSLYEYNYGDSSNLNSTSGTLTNHLFEFPGQYTVMASKFKEKNIQGYVQKKITVEHVQEFYTFLVMGPFENITDDSQITDDLDKIDNSKFKYNSLDYNSLPISPNTSYWKLQIADNENPSGSITKHYLDSGLEPKITVTNSSIQITVARHYEEMWLLKISANEVEPVSMEAKFEIYSSNLLLNPAGSNVYFTTRVFWIDMYDMNNDAEMPNVTVKISPVSISQNSGVYVYNGSIYMTDDSYTTFHKLLFKELSGKIDEAIFCTICFACTSDNTIYYRNYFVNDTLTKIPDHPENIQDLHIYSVESDDIPRETIASDVYDIAGPFFASYRTSNSSTDYFYSVLRFNGTTQIINLNTFTNITSIAYVTPISDVDWVIAIANEMNEDGNCTSSIIQINFKTLKINRLDCYNGLLDNNETIVGGYLQPYTEELITYTNSLVFISVDSGKTQTAVGQIKNGVISITSRHSADEVYILDSEGNFYILFGERKVMHLFETYKFNGLSLAVDSADTLYLITDEPMLSGCRAIPVECYINCFAIDHNFENLNNDTDASSNFSLEIVKSLDGLSYSFMPMPNHPYYFRYLSLFSTDGIEECKYTDDTNCRRLYSGDVFSSFSNAEIDEFICIDEGNCLYSIKFKPEDYLKESDIGKSLFILDILVIFEITGTDQQTFYLKNTSKVILVNQNLNGSSVTCQIIDLRPTLCTTNINGKITGSANDGYKVELDDNEGYKFSQNSIGLIIESQANGNNFKAVIYNFVDSVTVTAKPIDLFGGDVSSLTTMTIRSPNETNEEVEFSIEPSRKALWHLSFSLCGGNVESQGTSSFHQNLPVYRLIEDEDLVYEITIPSDSGSVQTRFSQPDLVLSTTNFTNHQFVYTMVLNSSTIIDTPSTPSSTPSSSSGATESYNSISSRYSIPFSRVISLYKDGSPRCASLSVVGVSPLCPADQRLVVTPDDEEREILELDVNYRPPSIEGNQIGLSKNVYNRDPSVPKILKSRLKKSREEFASVPNRCKDAKNISQCHCERAELEKMNEEDTDCLKFAYTHDFSSTFSPRVHLQSYIGGEWVVTDPEPQVYIMEVNGRTDLCVNGKCTKKSDEELPFQTGDEIQMKGIELWHLKFRTIGSCSVSCYYMMYIERPPLMRNMVYLIQGHAAIVIGLFLLAMAIVAISKENKDRKPKQD